MRSAVCLLVLAVVMVNAQPFSPAAPANPDSSQQSPEAQTVNAEPSLWPRHAPETLCRTDTSREIVPCLLALGIWEAMDRERPCDETAPCLAIGFVLTICVLLVFSGTIRH
ncbi:hypothetical protein JXD38_04305 [candidate division WOR-3 bacterium]|nr:hypothetical protein [candidate division WOR-3 bacterium]